MRADHPAADTRTPGALMSADDAHRTCRLGAICTAPSTESAANLAGTQQRLTCVALCCGDYDGDGGVAGDTVCAQRGPHQGGVVVLVEVIGFVAAILLLTASAPQLITVMVLSMSAGTGVVVFQQLTQRQARNEVNAVAGSAA